MEEGGGGGAQSRKWRGGGEHVVGEMEISGKEEAGRGYIAFVIFAHLGGHLR